MRAAIRRIWMRLALELLGCGVLAAVLWWVTR